MKKNFVLIYLILFLFVFQNVVSAEEPKLPKGLKGISIGGVWYLSYQAGKNNGVDYNSFKVKRSYVNIKKKINPWLSGRITPDGHQDDTGDYKVRLKYAYAQFNFPSFSVLHKPFIEWGLVHMPWLDFEEHINYYRAQDKMFMERNGLFNSADVGFTFVSLFGGDIDKEYQENVNSKYPGKYGSMAVGIYNGGGYHAKEKNINKIPEWRFTLRPLPDVIPGLQFSYFGLVGKGNTALEPDWVVNTEMASYESCNLILTGTYYTGKGNQKGTEVDQNGRAKEKTGYSTFAEVRFPEKHFSFIGRYDRFDFDTNVENDEQTRIILGFAYHLSGHNTLLFDYDVVQFDQDKRDSDPRFQVTMEMHF